MDDWDLCLRMLASTPLLSRKPRVSMHCCLYALLSLCIAVSMHCYQVVLSCGSLELPASGQLSFATPTVACKDAVGEAAQ